MPERLLARDHLGSHDTQTTTLRAFRAAEQYAFGERGRPCFKRFNELQSIEGKEQAVIRYKADPIPALHYSGLVIPLMLDPKDKDRWQQEALACRVKYSRILRRKVRGKARWYAQLVKEGLPPTKGRVTGQGVLRPLVNRPACWEEVQQIPMSLFVPLLEFNR